MVGAKKLEEDNLLGKEKPRKKMILSQERLNSVDSENYSNTFLLKGIQSNTGDILSALVRSTSSLSL